jgi:hypothetical protein
MYQANKYINIHYILVTWSHICPNKCSMRIQCEFLSGCNIRNVPLWVSTVHLAVSSGDTATSKYILTRIRHTDDLNRLRA